MNEPIPEDLEAYLQDWFMIDPGLIQKWKQAVSLEAFLAELRSIQANCCELKDFIDELLERATAGG